MGTKTISKAQEIELLNALNQGNGYFKDAFGDEIPKLIENIKNDFPLLHNLDCVVEVGEYTKALEHGAGTIKERDKARHELEVMRNNDIRYAEELIGIAVETGVDDCYRMAIKMAGRTYCVAYKIKQGLALSSDDRDFLVEILEG